MSWAVSTSQGNDYDIASFTLEYRYYVPVVASEGLSRRC